MGEITEFVASSIRDAIEKIETALKSGAKLADEFSLKGEPWDNCVETIRVAGKTKCSIIPGTKTVDFVIGWVCYAGIGYAKTHCQRE